MNTRVPKFHYNLEYIIKYIKSLFLNIQQQIQPAYLVKLYEHRVIKYTLVNFDNPYRVGQTDMLT